jgi:hypothetical protein
MRGVTFDERNYGTKNLSNSHVAILRELLIKQRLDCHPTHWKPLLRCRHIITAFLVVAAAKTEIGKLKKWEGEMDILLKRIRGYGTLATNRSVSRIFLAAKSR